MPKHLCFLLLVLFPMLLTSAFAEEPRKIGTLKAERILFLGNSITLHAPAPQIGWNGNWGMAASAPEKDFVHLLIAKVAKETGKQPEVKVKNIAEFERQLIDFNIAEQLKEELLFQPDLIVLAIGENATSPTSDVERTKFSASLDALLSELKKNGQPTIFVRSQFWPDQEKDQLLKQATEKAKGVWVDMEKIGTDPLNAASAEREFQHAGVAGHPGDKGMAAIADKIWQGILSASQDK
jgi:hypothetical protein